MFSSLCQEIFQISQVNKSKKKIDKKAEYILELRRDVKSDSSRSHRNIETMATDSSNTQAEGRIYSL